MKKYKLTKETKEYNGKILYRIKALKDFNDVKAGDLGGWVESEFNLSHDGNCWIYDDAEIRDYAIVHDSAKIHNDAFVRDHAIIRDNAVVRDYSEIRDNAEICGNAIVADHAIVRDSATVLGNAKICGNTVVGDHAIIIDHAEICDYAFIRGNAKISNNALIKSSSDYCYIKGFGSEFRNTTFFKNKDGNIYVNCGCFNGTLDQFREQVIETHGDNKYAREYLTAIEMVKIHFDL